MDVFDSNIWVRGFTQTNQRAMQLVSEVSQGTRDVFVSAYVYEEVFEAFDRSHQQQAAQLKDGFAKFLRSTQAIVGPSHSAVQQIDLRDVRTSPECSLIGDVLNIQAKDAPVLLDGYEFLQSSPTIFTHDQQFAQLSPGNHNLNSLSVTHIPP